MRRREENDRVLELARQWRKPVVGGGDSHLLVAEFHRLSVAGRDRTGTLSPKLKTGGSVPFVTPDYFAPLNWKLFLRVLYFMSRYRQIASYQGQPVAAMLEQRRVLLDPVGSASRAFLALVSALGLAR